jgi:uncharacterized membrane protein
MRVFEAHLWVLGAQFADDVMNRSLSLVIVAMIFFFFFFHDPQLRYEPLDLVRQDDFVPPHRP